ncbi:MAG: hypothetical protein HRT45_05585 [Bdellovibrionales bacterium]|nr:hypothetical protein [Bdellovibrionales bacterium]
MKFKRKAKRRIKIAYHVVLSILVISQPLSAIAASGRIDLIAPTVQGYQTGEQVGLLGAFGQAFGGMQGSYIEYQTNTPISQLQSAHEILKSERTRLATEANGAQAFYRIVIIPWAVTDLETAQEQLASVSPEALTDASILLTSGFLSLQKEKESDHRHASRRVGRLTLDLFPDAALAHELLKTYPRFLEPLLQTHKKNNWCTNLVSRRYCRHGYSSGDFGTNGSACITFNGQRGFDDEPLHGGLGHDDVRC